jgi:hypothetical protein
MTLGLPAEETVYLFSGIIAAGIVKKYDRKTVPAIGKKYY